MSQDAVNQNINLNVSGAEKVAEATALLQDFQGMIQQVLTNPAYSSYAWNRIAHGLERSFVDPLKRSVQLSQEQGLAFDRLVAKSRGIITVTGFISGMAAALAKTTLEIQKASAELGKFTSFNNMPGGASNLFQAQTSIMKMTADNTIEFNEQFAQQTEQVYLELRRKLSAGGMDEENIQKLTKRLALLQAGLGVNAPGFVSGLANQFRSFGFDEKAAAQVFSLIMGEVQKGETLPFFNPQEAAGIFTQGVMATRQAGTNPVTGARQVLDVMQTYGKQLGPEQMQQLFQVLPQFVNELKQNVMLRATMGVTEKDLTGDKALINIANAFAKEVQKVSGGKPIENIMDYINKGGIASRAILERLGISNDMLQLFNTLPQNQKAVTDLSNAFEKMRLSDNVLDSSQELFETLDMIEESLRNSSSLLEWLSAYWTKFSTTIIGGAKEIGIDPKLLQAAALGLGVGGLIKFGPSMLRNFLKASGVPLSALGQGTGTGVLLYDAAGQPLSTAGQVAGVTDKMGKFGRFAGVLGQGAMGIQAASYMGYLQSSSKERMRLEEAGLSNEQVSKIQSMGFQEDALSPRSVLGFFGMSQDKISAIFGPSRKEEQIKFLKRLKKGTMTGEEFGKESGYLTELFGERGLEFLKENTYLKDRIPKFQYLPGTKEYEEQQKELKKPLDLVPSYQVIDSFMQYLEKPKTTEEEGAAGDIGNLRIIISNDAGNELANTTLRDAQNQGYIRLTMSAVSEA